jgi:hypothetical protein
VPRRDKSDLDYSREMASGKDYAKTTVTLRGGDAPVMWEAACDPGTRKFTAACDVFMFGLAMWETLSHGRALLGQERSGGAAARR